MPEVEARQALQGRRLRIDVLRPYGAWIGCGTLRVLRCKTLERRDRRADGRLRVLRTGRARRRCGAPSVSVTLAAGSRLESGVGRRARHVAIIMDGNRRWAQASAACPRSRAPTRHDRAAPRDARRQRPRHRRADRLRIFDRKLESRRSRNLAAASSSASISRATNSWSFAEQRARVRHRRMESLPAMLPRTALADLQARTAAQHRTLLNLAVNYSSRAELKGRSRHRLDVAAGSHRARTT